MRDKEQTRKNRNETGKMSRDMKVVKHEKQEE